MAIQRGIDNYTNSQMTTLIDEYIHSERDRAILKRRLIDGLTFDELADEFNLSQRRIKDIVYRQQEWLFEALAHI